MSRRGRATPKQRSLPYEYDLILLDGILPGKERFRAVAVARQPFRNYHVDPSPPVTISRIGRRVSTSAAIIE